jgi:hypothetical protein
LGIWNVDALALHISSKQLAEWMAYYRIEPWGEERGDLRSAMVASIIANVNRKKGAKPFRPIDFMPYFAEERDQMDRKALNDELVATFKAMGNQ